MSDAQRTLQAPIAYSGTGLHTGRPGNVRLVPAEADTGIRFVRVDQPGRPEVRVSPENAVYDAARGRRTILGAGGVEVHTVEHLLAALAGMGVDNLVVEVDALELPEPRDGSALPIVELIRKAGLVEQAAPRRYFHVDRPVVHSAGPVQLLATPHDGLRLSFTIVYDDELVGTQHATFDVDPETFAREIAPARTFVLDRDVEGLRAQGLIQGGRLDNGVVVRDGKVINPEPLRFRDEFVRHKVLDFLGDLFLMGRPMRGHFTAIRSGHESNVAFVRLLAAQAEESARTNGTSAAASRKPAYDIQQIMDVMPHRYPFLLVDRILELEAGKRVVGIKNVTMNEPFFQGHFPGRPVMPGVLVIEAMAQCGGFMFLNTVADPGGKLMFFMGIDNARFRRQVLPGDTLRIEVEMVRLKVRMCKVHAKAFVDGELAAEADLLSGIADNQPG
ncbi:MAG: bifunctional UDP-3-O-[3-hydroxymyristoyl] N-acetylglucosamine deacetylase/3-hydroxyacyl-ACP dehydratase [Candidatus Eisenbacteria bacterium]|nr:bifunctional UDP-3-O-[3-hydroxymyristoyl] N-acetylglucosamine deacetylase/3-hydroxyacyl-ACP dehydratase [Candidatus Eisenbacteria bacterium]